jgi:DNA-binding winged helix-turn-helix (wHTH) protein
MRYIFADCVLDTALATLHRAGQVIPLRPKVFHLLQYLLEQRAHPVTKDVLCAQVWPGQCISDAALEGCIKLARQAIGDSGRAQRLIQTRRGYGYRFVGAVEEQAVGAVSSLLEPALPLGESETSPAGVEEAVPRLPVTGVADGGRKLVILLGCALVHTVALHTRLGLDAWHSRMRTLYALWPSERSSSMAGRCVMCRVIVSWRCLAPPWLTRTTLGGPCWPRWGSSSD